MKPVDASYEGLVDALARHIHANWCLEKPDLVDDMCASQFQIPTGVLCKAGILVPIEGTARYYAFACPPEDFKRSAVNNEEDGCDYDTVVLALILVVDIGMGRNPDKTALIECLLELGICEPRTFDGPAPEHLREEIGRSSASEAPSGVVRFVVRHNLPPTRYVWTDKEENYTRLYNNDWLTLVQ